MNLEIQSLAPSSRLSSIMAQHPALPLRDGVVIGATRTTPFNKDPVQRLRRKPEGIRKARIKHQWDEVKRNQEDSVKRQHSCRAGLTFMDRFYSLPRDVRNRIYRLLLVQPCKFDMHHKKEGCIPSEISPVGQWDSLPEHRKSLCAICQPYPWHLEAVPRIFVSPARSRWAPPMLNEFLCDNCYSDRIRSRIEPYHPSLKTLPCLCTRRQNLHVLLNYDKKFYREAAYIFWTENRFAFENPKLLIGFLSSIRPEVRSCIRRISFFPRSVPKYEDDDDGEDMSTPGENKLLRWCWKLLRQCNGLSELELDVQFLSKLSHVLNMRQIKVERQVTFVCWERLSQNTRPNWVAAITKKELIWKFLHERRPVEDNALADTMAMVMTGRRPQTVKFVKDVFSCHKQQMQDSRKSINE